MKHVPMHPELLSEQQKVEVIVHLEQLFLAMLAADAKLLTYLDPAGLPNDLGAQVRQYADAQRDLVNASRAELDRIVSRDPNRASDQLQ
jgi:hypothetical protein